MANYQGSSPVEYSRWLGLVDESDPTNVPMGCASVCQNIRFTLTEIETRFGIRTAIQGKNRKPITGLIGGAFTPESATQTYFQSILLYDYAGALMIENPTGTGRTSLIPAGLATLPAQSHMIGTQAYNRAWMAFSNLLTPTAFPAVYDLMLKSLYPYGMKPVGAPWSPGLQMLVGECLVPSTLQNGSWIPTGNGHLYICTVAGTTGQVQPNWPVTEGGTVVDGGATFKEQTPVLANRLPNPAAPQLTRVPGAGALPAGDDIWVMLTFVNQQGESLPSVPSKIVNTVLNDQIQVAIPTLASLAGWIQGLTHPYIPTGCQVYVAAVATGGFEPASGSFQQLAGGQFALGTTANINAVPATGITPPTVNGARVTGGQLPTPITAPVIQRDAGAGAFPAGRDVYFCWTFTNNLGETLPGPASSIINTQLNDAVLVTIQWPQGYALTGINLYECDVPTGTVFGGAEFPPFEQFRQAASGLTSGSTALIGTSGVGPPPPIVNTTGTAGNIAQDTPQGGVNATQGLRYFAIAYEDLFDTISGFSGPTGVNASQGAVFSYDVDENGWELGIFNLPTGPSYIQNVLVNFTVADGTSAGPFYYIPFGTVSDGIQMTATAFPNGTSTATVNFTDSFLISSLNTTDRLRVIQPQQCVDMYYSPSTNRIFQTGVPGTYSGHWASLAADPESYYGDTSEIGVGNDDGERAWCIREYRSVLYSLRERSGFEVTPSSGDPSTWSVNNRWTKTGPVGPRAVDVCGEFMIFVHSSGIYKFENDYPVLVSKEIPRFWNTINWQAASTIWVAIDVEWHEVHIGLPIAGSSVPNVVLVLNYEEGWNNPLLFSRYSGKEITIEQCRKYSVWTNISAYLGMRIYRNVTGEPIPVEGPVQTEEEIAREYISQFVYASSAPDGTVQALTPGQYNDNGAGIDSRYEGVAVQQMMNLSKLNGINFNVRGTGQLFPYFVAGANQITDWHPSQPIPRWLVQLRPLQLELNPSKGISRNTPSRLSERWRPGFWNGAIADAWFSLKYSTVFVSPMFQGREAGENAVQQRG